MERDSNPKFLVIDVAEGLYRVSHQSWSKAGKGLYRVSHQSWNKAGKRQGNRNMYGRRFLEGFGDF